MLGRGRHTPDSVRTEAKVQILKQGDGFAIKRIELVTVGRVPGIDEDGLPGRPRRPRRRRCPISKALAAVPEITLDARLES